MTPAYLPRRPPAADERIVRGLRTHLTRWNMSNVQPIVLLHGFMDSGDTFQFLVDEMPDSRSFVAPDWRGFGRSEWATGGYWFPDYYADLDELLDTLGLHEPVVLIGHSMGGNVAMAYAGLRPERVRCVVNIEGFGLARTRPEQAPERGREWLRQLREAQEAAVFPSVETLARLLQRRSPRLAADRAAYIACAWTEEVAGGGVRPRFDPSHRRVNPVLYRREEAQALWREITAPVLFVVGDASDALVRVGGEGHPESMARIVSRLEPCWIADAGHMVHHEQPQSLAAAIESFLQRVVLP
jgi:pimeloyl-ACP methyl ester carboxylesterase